MRSSTGRSASASSIASKLMTCNRGGGVGVGVGAADAVLGGGRTGGTSGTRGSALAGGVALTAGDALGVSDGSGAVANAAVAAGLGGSGLRVSEPDCVAVSGAVFVRAHANECGAHEMKHNNAPPPLDADARCALVGDSSGATNVLAAAGRAIGAGVAGVLGRRLSCGEVTDVDDNATDAARGDTASVACATTSTPAVLG
jgi:hypothetical protein